MPLKVTIQILADRAFTDDWFNKTYDLKLQRKELVELLEMATTNQLFQFDGELYEQVDGVAMGSALGQLLANVFLCHLEDKLQRDGMIPEFCKRYDDDTLSKMPNTTAATEFLNKLNNLHPSLSFTMELPIDGKIPFVGMEMRKHGSKVET